MIRKLPKNIAEFFRETGRVGGKIGGKRSLETMKPEARSERARKAAVASAEARRKGAPPPLSAVVRNLEASRNLIGSSSEALILADQLLNRLLGYPRQGSRARKDCYRKDLNWIADVLVRMEAGERDPLRPRGE
jgi:hypothetical protein